MHWRGQDFWLSFHILMNTENLKLETQHLQEANIHVPNSRMAVEFLTFNINNLEKSNMHQIYYILCFHFCAILPYLVKKRANYDTLLFYNIPYYNVVLMHSFSVMKRKMLWIKKSLIRWFNLKHVWTGYFALCSCFEINYKMIVEL